MKHVNFVVLSLVAGLAVHCSKEKKEDTPPANTSDTSNGPGTIAISTNGLAVVYPEGLALSAFPQSVDPSPGVAGAGTVAINVAELHSALALADCTNLPPPPQPIPPECQNQNPGPVAPQEGDYTVFEKHPKEILEENQKRLSGEGECFSPDILQALSFSDKSVEACYGFDYGIVSGNSIGTIDQGKIQTIIANVTDQSLNGIKAALQAEPTIKSPEQSEACMVATGRKLVNAAAARVDAALKLIGGMLCQSKKNGDEELPAIGSSKDLTSLFTDFDNATVSKAEVTRLEDKADRTVFKSSITFKPANGGKEITFALTHSPGTDGNGTYDGVLTIENEVTDDQTQETYAELSSVSYSKYGSSVSDQKLKIEIRDTSINKVKIPGPYFDTDGKIDLNIGANENGDFGPGDQNSFMKGVRYFAFDINPSSYAGNIAFWNNPGGSYNEKARGFVYETQQNTDGTLSGCSYAGADVSSIRYSVAKNTSLTPTGCYTPQISNGACGNANDNVGPQIFKQCFKQNADGFYKVDTDLTKGADGIDVLIQGTDSFEVPKVTLEP